MILEELGLPYETSWVELEDLKKEPFESINPNGRVPGKSSASVTSNLLYSVLLPLGNTSAHLYPPAGR